MVRAARQPGLEAEQVREARHIGGSGGPPPGKC